MNNLHKIHFFTDVEKACLWWFNDKNSTSQILRKIDGELILCYDNAPGLVVNEPNSIHQPLAKIWGKIPINLTAKSPTSYRVIMDYWTRDGRPEPTIK